jgi:ankyrin repeat protein
MITKTDNILSTPPPEQTEDVRKQYENMSYDEMSQRIAESYKQLSELLGNRISLPSTISTSTTVDDADDYDENVIERQDMDDGLKRQKCTKLFLKSASSGDLEKVLKYLETMKPFIDINAKDEDGTTPLIYAACFGKFEIAQALLTAGAKIDSQDSRKELKSPFF